MALKIEPLKNMVLVRPHDAPERSEGGIYIPDRVREREKPRKGEVLAVGPGKVSPKGKPIPMTIKVGDVILYGRFAGNESPELDNCILLSEDEIYARVIG